MGFWNARMKEERLSFKVQIDFPENIGITTGQTKERAKWVGQWSLGIAWV